MRFLWHFYGIPVGFLWCSYRVSMIFLWDLYAISMGFPWDLYKQDSYVSPMEFPWYSIWFQLKTFSYQEMSLRFVWKENQLNIDSNELNVNGFQWKTGFVLKGFFDIYKENQLKVDSNEMKVNGFQLKAFFSSRDLHEV